MELCEKLLANRCIAALSLPLLQRYFDVLKLHGKEVVSVGSGIGTIEKHLDKDDNIICVDPEPFSYQYLPRKAELQHSPDYDTVESLVIKRRDLIENCSLLINWPNPSLSGNEGRHDIDSVLTLKPDLVLIVLERTGGAGSLYLVGSLMKKVELKNKKFIPEPYQNLPLLDDYELCACTTAIDKYDVLDSNTCDREVPNERYYSYVLLRRKCVNEIDLDVPLFVDSDQFFQRRVGIDLSILDKDECIIC